MQKEKTQKSRLEATIEDEVGTVIFGIRSDGTINLAATEAGIMPLKGHMLAQAYETTLTINLKMIAKSVKKKMPWPLEDDEFYSKKAGSFSGVKQRTLQKWTDDGLIVPLEDATGKGNRRKYSLLNCIEIGIINSLTNVGLHFKHIKKVMEWLREEV